MAARKFVLHDGRKGVALAVRVTPRAKRNEIVEVLSDQTVKIRLTAPPVEGKANQELVKFLAEVLDVPKSRIEVVGGATGRDKIVSVLDMDSDTVQQKILAYIS